jgi:hypothetical protein
MVTIEIIGFLDGAHYYPWAGTLTVPVFQGLFKAQRRQSAIGNTVDKISKISYSVPTVLT